MIVLHVHGVDAILAAQFDRSTVGLCCSDAIHEEAFEIGLLQVDEGRIAVPFLRQEVEFVDLPVFMEDLAEVPDDSLLEHRQAAAVPMGNLKRTLRETDGAAALTHAFVVIEENDRDALQAEIQRRCDPDGAAADDDNWMAHGGRCVLISAAFVGVELERKLVAVVQHCPPPGNPQTRSHQWRSHPAVRMPLTWRSAAAIGPLSGSTRRCN